jgi:predicted permease
MLALYPASFRRAFGERMAETFADRYAERAREGSGALALFLVRFVIDGVRAGMGERVRPSRALPPDVSAETPEPSMSRILDMLRLDIRFALRSLVRRPGFTATAVATLAVGIGGNAAIFSLVNGVLLSPLPYPEPDGLITVQVAASSPGGRPGPMSYPDLVDIAERSPGIGTLVGYNSTMVAVTQLGEPFVMDATRVTEGVMATFRVAPALGRDIRPDEFGPDGPLVAVIGHGLWRERFAGSPDVLGRTLTLDGDAYEIVGVAPEGFEFPTGLALWIPRRLDVEDCARGCHSMSVVGRMTDGASLEGIRTETDAIAATLQAEYPTTNVGKGFVVRSLKETVVGDVRQGLWVLLAAVGLVLFIACANVVNLLLARASAREGETAVRTALGASTGRLVGQGLVESAVLAVAGGLAGIGVAVLGVDLLRTVAATTVPRVEQIGVDGPVLALAAACVILVTFIFGMAPVAGRARPAVGLAHTGRGGSAGGATLRFRNALLTGEVAVSVALLIGAGLLLRTFTKLYAVDVGFRTESVLRFNVEAPEARYATLPEMAGFFRTLEDRIAALPGVEAVGSMFGAPLGRGRASSTVYVEGRPDPEPQDEIDSYLRAVSPGLIATLDIPVVQGRALTPEDDRPDAEPVAVVNQAFARRIFPGEDPLGRRVSLAMDLGWGEVGYRRIVGVVSDVHFDGLTIEPQLDFYVPQGQFGPESLSVHVRTRVEAASLVSAIRSIVQDLDPDIPIYRVETMEEAVTRLVAPTRLYVVLVGAFAAAAALLAAVGLYGVVSFVVARRTREIGIRQALGADRAGIVRHVVIQGMRPAVLGLVLGLAGAWGTARALEAVLFGVSPRDPVIFAAAAALLMAVTATATAIPALRASRLYPGEVLRAE